MAYLTVAEFRLRTVMPGESVDELEARFPAVSPLPSWLSAQLDFGTGYLDSRLRKRYAAPFSSPYPEVVCGWLADWVTPRAYLKLGIDPSNLVWAKVEERATAVDAALKEAADAVTGLYDLPLRSDTTTSGLRAPAPLGYSERSPYTGRRNQVTWVRGGGT